MTDLSDYLLVLSTIYGVPPNIIVKGQGCILFGHNGESYLDLAGGIAVSALGHCHPDIVKTITEQANRVWHLSNVLANEPAIHLAKALVDATFADRVFFCNSGAEQMKPPSRQHEKLRLPSLAQINPRSSHSMTLFMAELSLPSPQVVSRNTGPVSAQCPKVLHTYRLMTVRL